MYKTTTLTVVFLILGTYILPCVKCEDKENTIAVLLKALDSQNFTHQHKPSEDAISGRIDNRNKSIFRIFSN